MTETTYRNLQVGDPIRMTQYGTPREGTVCRIGKSLVFVQLGTETYQRFAHPASLELLTQEER